MATQAERSAATRRRLLDAARERFVTVGYEPTSTEQIRQLAGVSRGAMYHHFGSKRDLFEAVFEEVAVDAIRQAIREADTDESPLGQLTAASLAWLRVVRDRQVATILIEQAPNVLGWRHARAVEERTTLGLMRGALDRAEAAGEIDVVSVPVAAQLLSALLAEAALVDANGVPDVSRGELEASVRRFIDGLRSPPARSGR